MGQCHTFMVEAKSMREEHPGKAAIYLVLFLMSLSLHVQSPIFTPYAVTLGATSFFVSIILSSASLTDLCGNVIAGPFIDRIGKKPFIVIPLFLSSFLMAGHAFVDDAKELLMLRILNGFVLAFMSPACFALLSAYAKSARQQGKNMAMNALMVTVAGIVAPVIGGKLVKVFEYEGTYGLIGAALFVTAIIALFYVREADPIVIHRKEKTSLRTLLTNHRLVPIYFIGFALMFGHGTLIYELPFLTVEHGLSAAETGKLFSFMGIGTLVTLCMFWLNRFSALLRTAVGMFFTGFLYYQMATSFLPISLPVTLLGIGVSFGLMFPALTTLLTQTVRQDQHGSAFGILSAVLSLGIITSSLTSGAVREFMSPYYFAFLVTMAGAVYIVYDYLKLKRSSASYDVL